MPQAFEYLASVHGGLMLVPSRSQQLQPPRSRNSPPWDQLGAKLDQIDSQLSIPPMRAAAAGLGAVEGAAPRGTRGRALESPPVKQSGERGEGEAVASPSPVAPPPRPSPPPLLSPPVVSRAPQSFHAAGCQEERGRELGSPSTAPNSPLTATIHDPSREPAAAAPLIGHGSPRELGRAGSSHDVPWAAGLDTMSRAGASPPSAGFHKRCRHRGSRLRRRCVSAIVVAAVVTRLLSLPIGGVVIAASPRRRRLPDPPLPETGRRRGGEPAVDSAPEEVRRGAAVVVACRRRRCSSPPACRSRHRRSKVTRSRAAAAAALSCRSYSAPTPAAAHPRVRERRGRERRWENEWWGGVEEKIRMVREERKGSLVVIGITCNAWKRLREGLKCMVVIGLLEARSRKARLIGIGKWMPSGALGESRKDKCYKALQLFVASDSSRVDVAELHACLWAEPSYGRMITLMSCTMNEFVSTSLEQPEPTTTSSGEP
uniref:Uncharacterized protein n=1 Tax=Oryza rufipogon TaxID=4529 RepID=A0A0E0NIH3_ORYRU